MQAQKYEIGKLFNFFIGTNESVVALVLTKLGEHSTGTTGDNFNFQHRRPNDVDFVMVIGGGADDDLHRPSPS